MTEHRGVSLVLLAFAVSLAALAVAAGTAYARCGEGSDCSYQLALSIFAVAPAALVGAVTAVALRAHATAPWLRSLLLAGGVAAASVPLGLFLVRDAWVIALFAGLLALVLLLIAQSEREDLRALRDRLRREVGAQPSPPIEAPLPLEPGWQPAPSPAYPGAAPPVEARAGGVVGLVQELGALNVEILRLSEGLPRVARRERPRRLGRVRLRLVER